MEKEFLRMESMLDKLWAVVAAAISALGGYVIYERQRVEARISKIESDLSQHRTDLAVVKEGFFNLKEDIQEIKEYQKSMIDLLTNRRRK